MRKKLLAITAAVILFAAAMSTSVMADNGSSRDYAGSGAVVYSDIGAYVNHYPIASYSCGGKTVVVAEDLRSFGFDVDWNDSDRALYITPSYSGSISGSDSVYSGAGRQGRAFAYVLNSDIKVYINGREIPAYCIDGYMLISLEDLASLTDGIEFTWDSSTRSAKLWISWCPITVWHPIPVRYEDASADSTTYTYGISEVEPYQGVFKKDDKYIAISLYTGAVPGESEIGVVEQVTKPRLTSFGNSAAVPEFDIIGEQGVLLDEGGNTYSVVINGEEFAISFYAGGITLNAYASDNAGLSGEYIQVSNSGANMPAEDIWYIEPGSSSSGAAQITQSKNLHDMGNRKGYEYCFMGMVVGKAVPQMYREGTMSLEEIREHSKTIGVNFMTDNGLTPQKALDVVKATFGDEVSGVTEIYPGYALVRKGDHAEAEFLYEYYKVIYCPNGSTWAQVKNVPCYEVYASAYEDFDDTHTSGKVIDLNNNIIGEAN